MKPTKPIELIEPIEHFKQIKPTKPFKPTKPYTLIQYFKIVDQKTIAIDKPIAGSWVNILPPLRNEEFVELSSTLDIPIDFLKD